VIGCPLTGCLWRRFARSTCGKGKRKRRKVDRVTANHSLSPTASQGTSNIPFPCFLVLGFHRQAQGYNIQRWNLEKTLLDSRPLDRKRRKGKQRSLSKHLSTIPRGKRREHGIVDWGRESFGDNRLPASDSSVFFCLFIARGKTLSVWNLGTFAEEKQGHKVPRGFQEITFLKRKSPVLLFLKRFPWLYL
jgi:hypothetical protein